jgi:ergothioneine biosynthesis protein EgtB
MSHCRSLSIEDHSLQAEAFTSPPKWHLAHTTWFFETFILVPFLNGYEPENPRYEMLFNSYYNGIGEQFPRPKRALLSRPSLEEIHHYRSTVEAAILQLLADDTHPAREDIHARVRLGIEHECQHQELFFTDIKYSLSINPLSPAFLAAAARTSSDDSTAPLAWSVVDGGLVSIGHDAAGFCFDNEQPRHQVYIEPFELARRLVTNGEYAQFIADGGYQRPELWLADGWNTLQRENWTAPLYWWGSEEYTLEGLVSRSPKSPVTHISGYEAEAYARWAGARLPTEQEWEVAASIAEPAGTHVVRVHPEPADSAEQGLQQLYDACWQWTRSAYVPYPGFSPVEGAIGEYNGKFMSNQWVLRGGSCVSSPGHLRPSYRNFFYPEDRWQFTGLRLARDSAQDPS